MIWWFAVAFSNSLVDVCPYFPKEASSKLLIPLIQQLTKDEFHTVRNNIISRIDVLAEALGAVGVTNGILPNLLELAKDPKWRVRKTVVDKMGMLSKCLGVKVFEKKLQPVVIASLSDHVYAIRERACVQVCATPPPPPTAATSLRPLISPLPLPLRPALRATAHRSV